MPAFTLTEPLVKGIGKETFIELLPCPLFMTAFTGTVQTYILAPTTVGQV